jgi:hydroxylamine reductase (hybrid-cluster protein)
LINSSERKSNHKNTYHSKWRETDINTAFDRFGEQKVKCGFGKLGVCCRLCSNGPCRITPDSTKGVCGATADSIVARNFLRMVAADSACYLHVCEATARRLKSIGEGVSPLPIRYGQSLDELAALFGVGGSSTEEKARLVADKVLADLYKPRDEQIGQRRLPVGWGQRPNQKNRFSMKTIYPNCCVYIDCLTVSG